MATWNVVLAQPPDAEPIPIGVTNITVEQAATSIDVLATVDRGTSLIVIDERLASRAGGDLLTAIRQRAKGRELPILLLASRQRAGSVIALARGRADAVLFDPIDLRELAYTVVRLLHRTQPAPSPGPTGLGDTDLADIWNDNRDEVAARVATIDEAARALLEGRLTPTLRESARAKAHQLAGTLGVFGLATAGRQAKAVDDLLTGDAALRPEDGRRLVELAVALRDAVDSGPAQDVVRPPGPSVAIVVADGAARARLEAEARALDLRVSRPDEGVDGAVVALAADPLLLAARAMAAKGAVVLVQGMVGSTIERVAVNAVAGALYLAPAADARTAIQALTDALARTHRLNGTRVLVVDDDPLVHTAVRRLLEAQGALVTTIADPLDTFAILEREPPDIAILDVDMHGLTGIELCRLIRGDARWSRLLVIFCTTSTDGQTIQRVWAVGADDYVPKPIGPLLLTRIGARLAARSGASVTGGPGGGVDVALIEDDVPLARLVIHALEVQGLRARHVADGAQAIEQLVGPAPALTPRVVLLDVGLPGADGYEVLRRIAPNVGSGRTRVIMLTARAAEPDVVRALELGAFDHVAKPFSIPVLLHRVRRALASP